MKKTLIVFFILVTATIAFCAEDLIKMPVATALNTSTYVAVETGSDTAFGFAVMISDGTGWYMASDVSGTGEQLIDTHLTGLSWGHYVNANTTVFWAKAVSGTPDIVLFPGKYVKD